MESWVEMVAVLGVLGSIVNLGTYALVAKVVVLAQAGSARMRRPRGI
jgi:hypothetical protein